MTEELDQDSLFEDLVPDVEGGDPETGPEGGTPPDPEGDPDTDPDQDPEGDPSAGGDPEQDPAEPADPEKDPAESGTEGLSGIEQYLAQFDIEGGMIHFDDNTDVHFNDLDPDKQAEILNQLHGQQATTVEDKYGLDQSEIGLINYLRQNETTVEAMIDQMANERVNTILATQNLGDTNFDDMEADSVYMNFLKKSSPEATPEQLEADLAKAKEQTNYDKVVESVRAQFKSEQQTELARAQQDELAQQQETLESQRQTVIDAAISIEDIDGIKLNDGTKNGILDHVLEVNDHGDSLFMEEVFSNPQNLLKAAFWLYNGSELMKQRDDYWKKEKSAAFKRGQQRALGADGDKISFSTGKSAAAGTQTGTPSQSIDKDYVDLDDIHFDN